MVQAAVAAVFIQDIDEIVYKVFLPAAIRAAIPEFHTPPYNNKYSTFDRSPNDSLRYHGVAGLSTLHFIAQVGILASFLIKIPIIVGVSVAVVLALRHDSRIMCP